jgi:hypothetical protein
VVLRNRHFSQYEMRFSDCEIVANHSYQIGQAIHFLIDCMGKHNQNREDKMAMNSYDLAFA